MINGRLAGLTPALSAQRLEGFVPPLAEGGTPQVRAVRTIGRYLWNLALAEASYPLISLVEVAMRNRLNDAISAHASTPAWLELDGLLCDEEQPDILAAQGRLAKANKDVHDPGRLVAELMLGFWVSLFARRYANPATAAPRRLWPALLERAFPNIQAGLQRGETRGISEIRARFHLVNLYRNRISHHEPIWRGLTLNGLQYTVTDVHARTIEALSWLSPDVTEIARTPVVRIAEVLAAGEAPWVDHVGGHFPLAAAEPA